MEKWYELNESSLTNGPLGLYYAYSWAITDA